MSFSLTTYITTWDKKDPIDQIQDMINNSVLKPTTRIVLAFASFNFDSTTYIPGLSNMSFEDVKNFTNLVHSQGSKVSLSIGGATYRFSGSDLYSRPGDLASNINQVLKSCNFDGVDFDIEDNYAQVPVNFATQCASLINTLRSLNTNLYISLTTPGQAWASNMYQQSLLNMTIGNLNVWQPMEYDLLVDTTNSYTEQIISDINFYIKSWGVIPSKIVLGLMPGADDMGHILSLEDAITLATFAQTQKLAGVMTWDANVDGLGVDGNSPYAYAISIQYILGNKPAEYTCCTIS